MKLGITALLLSLMMLVPSQISFSHDISPSDMEGDIIEMMQQVNESLVFYYLSELVKFGPRYTGSENCSKAAGYIYNEFQKMGLWVRYDEWEYAGFKSQNVVATLNGTSQDNKIFIMSAHYDTYPNSPGADDDASGVAAVLASAKIMSQYDFDHTIKFIAFSGEEVGAYGSFTYAKEAYEKGDNIVAVINIDMVGYADTVKGGKILRVFETERARWISSFSTNISKKYMNIIDLSIQPIPNYRGADHQSFLDYGYDAVFFAHYDGYRWGHSPDDTLEHINHTYQIKATKFFLALMAELANKPIDLQIIIKTPLEGFVYFFGHPFFPLSMGRFWYAGLRGTTILLGSTTASVDVLSKDDIDYIIFCIDNEFISWDRTPPYEWKIQGKHSPPIGKHRLIVYAYDINGNIAKDEMDIIIFTLSYQYAPW
ncbi:MAG: M20/M25/M40 family metallo-hydrolase [Thermoplasmata archaeon]|nr:MAG: M20/M25/M40 family metallo-hydrolase [Thermoplasmata archaeon]